MVNKIKSAIGGLAMLASSAFADESVTNKPYCTGMRFTDVTFPVTTNALELTYSGFNTTGDWYLFTTDKMQGTNTVWRPATNQGLVHPRGGYLKGSFPFEVTTTNAPTIITEYLDKSKS